MSDELRNQINDIIEGEIQLGINEFLEEKQKKEADQGLGFVTSEEAKNLKVKISNAEIDKIMKEYKKIKKREKIYPRKRLLFPKLDWLSYPFCKIRKFNRIFRWSSNMDKSSFGCKWWCSQDL